MSRAFQLLLAVAAVGVVYYASTREWAFYKAPETDVEQVENGTDFRVMTFNTWLMGLRVKDGLHKIAKHIKTVNPDVALLQEVQTVNDIDRLLDLLGPEWHGAFRGGSWYLDDAVLARHPMNLNNSFNLRAGLGVEVLAAKTGSVRVVGLHLDWKSMGNYATNNKLVTSLEQILAGESSPKGYSKWESDAYSVSDRVEQVKEMLDHDMFQKWAAEADVHPVFVAGDFNSASHLDWTASRRNVPGHGGWAVEWPTTKMVMDAGFKDSFRVKHPDPSKMPGDTWSLIQKHNLEWNWTIPEPQDRIDFIFYKSNQIRVLDSRIYCGEQTWNIIPKHFDNDYPSDHYAVITDFVIPHNLK